MSAKPSTDNLLKNIFWLAAAALAIALISWISLWAFATFEGNVSVIWPAAGASLMLVLTGGRIYAVSVFAGTLLAVLLNGDVLPTSLALAAVNAVEPLAGIWLLHRLRFDPSFKELRDYLVLTGTAAAIAALAASLGVATLAAMQVVGSDEVVTALLNWLRGDFLGIMVFVPAALVWRRWPSEWFAIRQINETLLWLALYILAAGMVFLQWFDTQLGRVGLGYWIFIFMSWAAIRFGKHGVTLITVITAIIGLLGAANGIGFFAEDFARTRLLNFTLYILVLTSVGMVLEHFFATAISATEGLVENREKLLNFIRHTPAAFAVFDRDMRYLSASNRWVEDYELAGRDLIGHSHYDIFPEIGSAWKEIHKRALAGESIRCDEEKFVRADGSVQWLRWEVRPWTVRAGVVEGVVIFSEDITKRKLLEQAITGNAKEFQALADAMPQIVWVARPDGWNTYLNRQWVEYTGMALEEGYGNGWTKSFHPDDQKRAWDAWQEALHGNSPYSIECRLRRTDGSYRWWLVRGVPVIDETGSIAKWFGTATDIDDLKQLESGLRIAATAFETQQATLITDSRQRIIRINKAFSEMTGYNQEDVLGKTPKMLQSGLQDSRFYSQLWKILGRDHYWQGEVWNRRKNGEVFPELLSISAVTGADGEVSNYVATFTDLTQSKSAEATIHNLSFFDKLTGLPNRSLMMDRLRHSLQGAGRSQSFGAVLLIDLDDFKTLNDSRGHEAGDLLLIELGKRFQAIVHGDDTVARVGSDEFVIILDRLSPDGKKAVDRASAFAERVQNEISQPFELRDTEYFCSASIGISLFGADEGEIDRLLSHAESALAQAKKSGRGTMRFFDESMQAALEERVSIEAQLRKAIPRELLLHYQVQVDSDGRASGSEVLVRWRRANGELVPPSKFIPLAEESEMILKIGRWVLETSCRQLKAWEADPATRHLSLSVNVSAKEFYQADFVDEVLDVLALTGADPSRLKLELTESMLVDNVATVVDNMNALKAKGIRFSLDDFGTGYSSLSYLRRLPIDQLKIDQSFTRDALTDPNDASIVRTIIALGQNLGLTVIAEGVESESQREFLAVNGCRYYQGYLFGRPMPIAQFEELIRAGSVLHPAPASGSARHA